MQGSIVTARDHAMPSAATRQRGEEVKHLIARLLGIRLISDIHERASDLNMRLPSGAKRRRRLDAIRDAGLLFVHIPKNAGMSICQALYAAQIKHASIRYYLRAAPDLVRAVPSFAVLRDPAERFVSAYRYARSGGSAENAVAAPFRDRYRTFGGIDDALNHVATARTLYEVDHIFRPQSWYVTDRHGAVAVDHLLSFADIGRIAAIVPGAPPIRLGHLNRVSTAQAALLPRHIDRLRTLYAQDYALFDRLRG